MHLPRVKAHKSPGRFGPILVRSGRFSPGRFSPISGAGRFGQASKVVRFGSIKGVRRFGLIYLFRENR